MTIQNAFNNIFVLEAAECSRRETLRGRKLVIILYILLNMVVAYSQINHGINWMQGSYYTNKIHFKTSIPYVTPLVTGMYFDLGSSCISDTDGNFKILCNGFKLMDSTGATIEGGDTITPSELCKKYDGFSAFSQFSFILPFRNDILCHNLYSKRHHDNQLLESEYLCSV